MMPLRRVMLIAGLFLATLLCGAPARAHNYLAGFMYMAGIGETNAYPTASDAEFKRLVDMARTKDPDRTWMAVGALGQTGRVDAVPILEKYTQSRMEGVAYVAYLGFSGIKDEKSAEAAIKFTREQAGEGNAPDPGNAEVAAAVFRGIGPPALKPLERFAESLDPKSLQEWNVFFATILRLFPADQTASLRATLNGRASGPVPAMRNVTAPASQDPAAALVARLLLQPSADNFGLLIDSTDEVVRSTDPSISPNLKTLAASAYPEESALALKLLAQRGDEDALNRLLAMAVHDDNSYSRMTAIQGLGLSHEPHAGKALLAALRRKPGPYGLGEEGGKIAVALGNLKDPATVAPLIEMLGDADKERAALAARALGEIGDRRAVPALLAHVGENEPLFAGQAMMALGRIGDRSATSALVKALGNRNLQKAALKALTQMKDPDAATPVAALLSSVNITWPGSDDLFTPFFRALGPASVSALDGAVSSTSSAARLQAASVLGRLEWPGAVAPLVRAVSDKDVRVRASAAKGLGMHPAPDSVAALIGALKDTESPVRIAAAEALWRLAAPEAHSALVAALRDKNPNVRTRAALALGDLGDDRGRALVLTWLKPNHGAAAGAAYLQADAIRLLTEWKEPAAVGALIEILGEDTKASSFDPGDEDDFARLAELKVKALQTITGQDFGRALYRWMAWGLDAGKWSLPPAEQEETGYPGLS